jgi:hypothetical protein
MENKTIIHLNSKAWYRTLKVLYIIAFLIFFFIYNILIWMYNKIRIFDIIDIKVRKFYECKLIGGKIMGEKKTKPKPEEKKKPVADKSKKEKKKYE